MLEIAHEGLDAVSPWIGVGLILVIQLVGLVAWLVNGRDDQQQLRQRQDELFKVTSALTEQMAELGRTLNDFRRELAEMGIERRLDATAEALEDHGKRLRSLEDRTGQITGVIRELRPGWEPWRA